MQKGWICNFCVCPHDRSVFNVQFKCMPKANKHPKELTRPKKVSVFPIVVLFLFVLNHVNHTCFYQEKSSGEKFHISPKLDLEYYG